MTTGVVLTNTSGSRIAVQLFDSALHIWCKPSISTYFCIQTDNCVCASTVHSHLVPLYQLIIPQLITVLIKTVTEIKSIQNILIRCVVLLSELFWCNTFGVCSLADSAYVCCTRVLKTFDLRSLDVLFTNIKIFNHRISGLEYLTIEFPV